MMTSRLRLYLQVHLPLRTSQIRVYFHIYFILLPEVKKSVSETTLTPSDDNKICNLTQPKNVLWTTGTPSTEEQSD